MRYRRKIGGSDTIPQPAKSVSKSPSVSSSIEGSYDTFKGYYTKIILFIKTNFIFSLLTAILIIVYIYFFTTDVVTKKDLIKDEIKLTCDTYDGKCPAGKNKLGSKFKCLSPDFRVDISDLKKKARELGADDKVDDLDEEGILSLIRKLPNNDLDNFKCNEVNCCVDITKCDNYNCPDFYSLKKGDPVCAKTKCTSKDCCDKTCGDFPAKDCKGDTINIPDGLCDKDNCLLTECCKDQKMCKGFNCKGRDKKGLDTIPCPKNKCDETICCDDSPTKPTTQPTTTKPTDPVTTTGDKTCDDHVGCPNDKLSNPSTIKCDPDGCTDVRCCVLT